MRTLTGRRTALAAAALWALAGLAGPEALAQFTAAPPPVVLLDTTMTVGAYEEFDTAVSADSALHYGYLSDRAFVPVNQQGIRQVSQGTLEQDTFVYQGASYTVKQLVGTRAFNPEGGAFRAVPASGPDLRVGTAARGNLALVLGDEAWLLKDLQTNTRVFALGYEGQLFARLHHGVTGGKVRVRLLDLGPHIPWRADVAPVERTTSAPERVLRGYRVETAGRAGAVPPSFDLRGLTYTVDRLEVVSVTSHNYRLEFSTTPDLPPDQLALLAVGTRGPSSRHSPLRAADRAPPDADFSVQVAEQYFDRLPASTEGWRVHLLPTSNDAVPPLDLLWSAQVTVGNADSDTRVFDEHGDFQSGAYLDFLGYDSGTSAGALPNEVALPQRYGPDVEFTVNRLTFVSALTDSDYRRLQLHTSAGLAEAARRGLGLQVTGDAGTHTYWLEAAEATNSDDAAADPKEFEWFPVGIDHGWNDGDMHQVRLVRGRSGESVSLSLTPDRVREGETVKVAPTLAINGPGFATSTTWWLRPVAEKSPRGASAADFSATGAGVTATLAAGGRSLTFPDVTLTATDDDESERSEDVAFRVCRTSSATPTTEADCEAGFAAARDLLILDDDAPEDVVYWSATLRPERFATANTEGFSLSERINYDFSGLDDSRSVGYVSAGVDLGSLSYSEFDCCSGRERAADEVGQTVTVLARNDASAVLHFATDGLFPDPINPMAPCPFGLTVRDRFQGAVLRVGGRTFPLTEGFAVHTSEFGSKCNLLFAYEDDPNDHEVLRDGEPVQVMLTGPRHPKQEAERKVEVSPATGTVGAGGSVHFHVRFDEAVTVAGAPKLKFQIDGADREAAYAGGSGTQRLRFRYEVQAADLDAQIDVPEFLSAASVASADAITSVAHGRAALWLGDGTLVAQDLGVDGTAAAPPLTGMLRTAPVREGTGRLPFEVVLSRAATAAVTVNYRVTPKSGDADGRPATGGTDFTVVAAQLEVPVGADSAMGEVEILDDGVYEPDEVFQIAAASADVTGFEPVVAKILDDDLPKVTNTPPPAHDLGALDGRLFEHEAALWSLTRDAGEWPEADLPALTAFVDAHATRGSDRGSVGTVEFAAGSTTALVGVVDDDDERQQTGTVSVGLEAGPDYQVAGTARHAFELRDDDKAMVELRIEPAALTVAEGSPARVFVVAETREDRAKGMYKSLTEPRDLVRVLGPHYSTGRIPAAVSATESLDGVAREIEVTSADAGLEKHTVPIPLGRFHPSSDGRLAQIVAVPDFTTTEDTDDDDGEKFGLEFDISDNNLADGRVAPGDLSLVTIRDGATLTLAFSASDASIAEGDDTTDRGSTTVTATVSPAQAAPFTVALSAQSPDDGRWEFVETTPTLSFAANATDSTGTVTIRAVPNEADDGNLEILVRGTPSVTAVPAADAVLTVADDDDPVVSIAPPPLAARTGHLFESEAEEGFPSKRWVLTRKGLLDVELDVTVRVTETGAGDLVDAATEASDQTVSFHVGHGFTSYSPITDDEVDEGHASVEVALVAGTGYALDAAADSATATVRDDDGTAATPLLSVALTPTALSVREGANANFTVTARTVADDTFTAPGDLERVFGVQHLPVTVSAGAGDPSDMSPVHWGGGIRRATRTTTTASGTPGSASPTSRQPARRRRRGCPAASRRSPSPSSSMTRTTPTNTSR